MDNSDDDNTDNTLGRRSFLKASLAMAAALAACSKDDSSPPPASSTPSSTSTTLFPGEPDPADLTAPGELPPTEIPNPSRFFGPDPVFTGGTPPAPANLMQSFKHVVVLQLENRSLDNLLGYLYPKDVSPQGQPFDGVATKNLSNPIPPYAPGSGQGTIPVSKATGLLNPVVDPAEQYGSVNVALYNAFNPLTNQFAKTEADYATPYNVPDQGAFFPPPMTGFITSFYWSLLSMGKAGTYEEYSTIMQMYPPSIVPAISQLAQNYGVCDNWHCAVPSQTYTNRAFFHAASSSGFVINTPSIRWPFENTAPVIFQSLTDANHTWTIYYDGFDIVPLTRLLHYPTLGDFPDAAPYFKDMTSFYDDVENGTLPDYTFIQPRFLLETNSYHPDYGAPAVKRGEILVNDIYQAIRNSNSPNGSNWLNTLFIITFDEGGTCYDHVPPPTAVPPGDGYADQDNFPFNRLGQRIPTILISPWIPKGTVFSTPLDATTLMKTLEEKFGLDALTARDAASTSLSALPCLPTPRTREDMPRLRLRKLSPQEAANDGLNPPGAVARDLVKMVNAVATGSSDMPPGVHTINDSIEFLKQNRPA
ncbi:hypothetical protein W02_35630 [Nitrospira sp. KM1]|uniref:alkaline phosphatase family protein n=1 Tax=Nitrospira sp. KM1 TaxID=1936990 RepID=UPI0013A75F32|nr:alkaline phosphatase family protein [Nitrospira sp. KM1]BCA56423.1 hypothetical protein W02_35630 [Nitrospira sp. KM1]